MMGNSQPAKVLTSWKEIAMYFGMGVRTVQRWERDLGLPVLRPQGTGYKSTVLAYPDDLEIWLRSGGLRRGLLDRHSHAKDNHRSCLPELRNEIRLSRDLRAANEALVLEILRSLQVLRGQCQALTVGWGSGWEGAPSPQDCIAAPQSAKLPGHVAKPICKRSSFSGCTTLLFGARCNSMNAIAE
jgi:hypothetical protein